jgi:hypothetical protein
MSYVTRAGRARNPFTPCIPMLHRLLQQCLAITACALNRVLVTVNYLRGNRPPSHQHVAPSLTSTFGSSLDEYSYPLRRTCTSLHLAVLGCHWSFVRYTVPGLALEQLYHFVIFVSNHAIIAVFILSATNLSLFHFSFSFSIASQFRFYSRFTTYVFVYVFVTKITLTRTNTRESKTTCSLKCAWELTCLPLIALSLRLSPHEI